MEYNPKLTRAIDDHLMRDRQSRATPRMGIVASYNTDQNTATVIMSDRFSDQLTDVIKDVPCPTNMGVQMVAPEPGRACWVAFDGQGERNPFILSFMNPHYGKYDTMKQLMSDPGIPRYMLDY